ncbi:MAG: AcrR family transcriptional regulator, partial [Myxococcota bacterium]
RVLDAAGALFSERGYSGVTLKQIASALKVRQAALYYHAPGGKEELFVTVTRRQLDRHREGLSDAIATAEPDIAAGLQAAAGWLLSQPPFDLARFLRTDLPALAPESAAALDTLSTEALLAPVEALLVAAYQRGEIRMIDPAVMARVFLGVVNTLHDLHRISRAPPAVVARDVIDTLLVGLRR